MRYRARLPKESRPSVQMRQAAPSRWCRAPVAKVAGHALASQVACVTTEVAQHAGRKVARRSGRLHFTLRYQSGLTRGVQDLAEARSLAVRAILQSGSARGAQDFAEAQSLAVRALLQSGLTRGAQDLAEARSLAGACVAAEAVRHAGAWLPAEAVVHAALIMAKAMSRAMHSKYSQTNTPGHSPSCST